MLTKLFSKNILSVRTILAVLIIIFLTVFGWWRFQEAENDIAAILKHNLLEQTQGITQAIDIDLVKALSFTIADKTRPEFLKIKQQITAYAKVMHLRSVYTMQQKNEVIYFGPENLDENDPMASPPGTIYNQPEATMVSLFKHPKAITAGPYSDEYGSFVSAFSPLLDPHSGKVLLIVGIDIPIKKWDATIKAAKLFAVFPMALIAILFVIIILLQKIITKKNLQLQESESKYRSLFEKNKAVMLLVQPETGNIMLANAAACEFYGWANEEFLQKNIKEINTLSAEEVQKEMNAVMLQNKKHFTFKHRLANANIRDVEVFSTPIIENSKNLLCSIVIDVTEKLAAKKALENSKKEFELIIEGTNAGTWNWNIKTGQTIFNERWAAMLGYTLSELEPISIKTWTDLSHPHDLAQSELLLQLHFANITDRYDCECRMKHKDGHYIWVHDRGQLTERDENNQPLRMLGTHSDISRRKANEAALLTINNNLKLATSAKSEFLANMSHEIRTPMNGVIGMAQLLLTTSLDTTQRRYVETICASGDSLLCLINDILDYSKIEANKLTLELLDFNLDDLLDDIVLLLAIPADKKGLNFICQKDSNVPCYLCGDINRLRQILNNLVGNAIKFTSKGKVAIKVTLISEIDNHVMLRFSVSDTGIGIPMERIGLLFQKFSQVDTSITRNYGGSGLGLAISKQLSELMGGTIGVESQKDKGSEFWFTVQLAKQKSAQIGDILSIKALTDTKNNSTLNKISLSARLLLVEDNDTNQTVALAMLDKFGIHVDIAVNGIEALKALSHTDYDLVLMDIQMPEMDGYEATRQIRSKQVHVKNSQVPIIAMTANVLKEDEKKCLDVGMNDYISKPIEIPHLLKTLQKWLQIETSALQEKEIVDNSKYGEINSNIFDPQALLVRVHGSQKSAKRIMEVFLKDLQIKFAELQIYIADNNIKGTEITSHAIKGAASSVSGEEVRAIAYEIEIAAKAGVFEEVISHMPALLIAIQHLQEEIKKWSTL